MGNVEQQHRSSDRQQLSFTGGSAKKSPYQEKSFEARQFSESSTSAVRLARGLGWFSIGIGLAELLAPRAVAKVSGVSSQNTKLIQLFGIRELASGVAIFMQGDQPSKALWSRVAGDALDLASLGIALASSDSQKARVGFATANVLAVTALDVLCAQQFSRNSTDSEGTGTNTHRTVTIDRPAEELYQAWRDFEQLPQFMRNLESVTIEGERRSHWVARTPAGITVKWDAEIVEDRPNELISWRSVEGSEVKNSGWVRFRTAPGNRGTIVTVELNYDLPGGLITTALAKLLREDPGALAQESLRLFKQVMEVGEATISDGTLWDNGFLSQRPAQPAETQKTDTQTFPAGNRVAAAGTRS